MRITDNWFAIGLLCFKIFLCAADYNEDIVEDLCNDGNAVVTLETDKLGVGTLKATSHPPYKPGKNCTIIIKPPADYGIVLSVLKIDMRERGNSCQDYIEVYHSDLYTSPTKICHYQFNAKKRGSFFSKGSMTIVYHASPALYPAFTFEEGFSLTYTVVAYDSQDCMKDDMFACNNGLCISKNLICDGKNNCGDRSDEFQLVCDSNSQKDSQNMMYWIRYTLNSFLCISTVFTVTCSIWLFMEYLNSKFRHPKAVKFKV